MTLNFSDSVYSVAWAVHKGEECLSVGFGKGIACFTILAINNTLQAQINWVVIDGQRLDCTNANATGVIGLTPEHYSLLLQLGAKGEPLPSDQLTFAEIRRITEAENPKLFDKEEEKNTPLSSSRQSFIANIGANTQQSQAEEENEINKVPEKTCDCALV